MLQAIGIGKHKGERQVLRNVHFQVDPGESVAIIGPNGSGKSTLLHSLALIDMPDSGLIKVDGQEFRSNSGRAESVWPLVTLVFQQLFLWPHLTVRENIFLSASKANTITSLENWVDALSVEALFDRFPSQLSQGERQRVALLRALILNPRYLLLDEITSAQDIEKTRGILDTLLELRGKQIGIVFVSHQLGFVQKLADRFIFLDHGAVVEEGTISHLASPESERLKNFIAFL